MKGAGAKWLGLHVGTVPMAAITREQIVSVRDAMTKAVLVGEIRAKRYGEPFPPLRQAL